VRILLPVIAAGLLLGCDEHSILPPQTPTPQSRLEVGPVLTDQGVDVGPAIAERIRERGLADAHVVAEPSGSGTYVDGQVKLSDADRGKSFGLFLGTDIALVTGLTVDLLGGGLLAAASGQSADAQGVSAVRSIGTGTLVVGLAITALGVYLAVHPSRYMDAKVAANLHVVRGDSATPLHLEDKASVWHDADAPQMGGRKLLDGVINGICAQTSDAVGPSRPMVPPDVIVPTTPEPQTVTPPPTIPTAAPPPAPPPPPPNPPAATSKRTSPLPPPGTAPGCNPPTWTDDDGHVHLKPGCQ